MEATAHSLFHAKLPKPPTNFSSFPYLHSKASFLASTSLPFHSSSKSLHLQGFSIKSRKQRNPGAVHASEAESPPTDVAERWLLEPVGQLALSFHIAVQD
jgi:hypothetical protein